MKPLIRPQNPWILFVFLSFLIYPVYSQDVTEEKTQKPEQKLQEYGKVIPDTAVTRKGVFTTHEVGNKLFYEIRASGQ